MPQTAGAGGGWLARPEVRLRRRGRPAGAGLISVAALAVLLLSGGGVAVLTDRADQRRADALFLAQVQGTVSREYALRLEVDNGHGNFSEAADLRTVENALAHRLDELPTHVTEASTVTAIRRLAAELERAASQESGLVAAGRQSAANQYHADVVEPAYLGLLRAVDAEAGSATSAASRTTLVGEVGATVILVCAALVALGLFRRDARRRREAAVGRAEARHLAAERRHLEERAQNFRDLFDGNPHPMLLCERTTLEIIAVNRAAAAQYGWTREELLRMSLDQLGPDHEHPQPGIAHPADADAPAGVWKHCLRDGRVIDVEMRSTAIQFDGRSCWLVLCEDVTERLALEDQLRHLASHDPLTGLPNRTLLLERVEHSLTEPTTGARSAMVLVDLDNFKTINDSLGHLVGDAVLTEVAGRLHAAIRPADMVARLGGDEFAILLGGPLEPADADAVVERLLAVIRRPMIVAGQTVILEASAGIALAEGRGDSPVDLLRDADAAMYAAKSDGKGRIVHFDADMRARVDHRLDVALDLRSVLERGQLGVVYQPRCAAGDLGMAGVEALVRWHHPERGLIGPDQFVPVAEESGLITEIDLFVLRTACRQTADWRRAGLGAVPFAVNISARDLDAPGFADQVLGTLAEHGLETSLLELELTETAAIRREMRALPVLERLRDAGVGLAIDDFGTGQSTLSRLRDFPCTALKIDRSFVQWLGKRPAELSLVRAIVAMGHALGLRVIAEGVEDAAQLAVLRECSCDELQGYLLGRPVRAEEIAARLAVAVRRTAAVRLTA